MNKPFDITDLRAILQATLSELQDKDNPGDIARARAISEVSGRVIDTVRMEIDYLRATGAKRGSGFIPHVEQPALEPENLLTLPTANGIKTVEKLNGGSVTTHRMR